MCTFLVLGFLDGCLPRRVLMIIDSKLPFIIMRRACHHSSLRRMFFFSYVARLHWCTFARWPAGIPVQISRRVRFPRACLLYNLHAAELELQLFQSAWTRQPEMQQGTHCSAINTSISRDPIVFDRNQVCLVSRTLPIWKCINKRITINKIHQCFCISQSAKWNKQNIDADLIIV